ncbi:MAG: adenosine-specific kinase [Thermoproteota archaeon]|nr:adenosine-specific kinase [Candidatus Brockarchaeota archaeon]MBO3768492.1 adenosine-specific kinase [Candidatus Brockarchaeota archaeon]MBO3802129.1 adenosine-specific kinase [Candidatus Brockarchaeota archaeon]
MFQQLSIKVVEISPLEGEQIIIGQAHFIKTVEDLYEALITSSTKIKFGIGFCESSGPALVRHEGNDKELEKRATEIAYKISAGHSFVIILKDAYPINILNRIKAVEEVVNIYCATGNPLKVLVVEYEGGRGIIGVIDGLASKGIEGEEEKKERYEFLRKIGYKK